MGGEGMSGGRERRTRGGQRRARKGRAADKRRKARRKRRTSGAQSAESAAACGGAGRRTSVHALLNRYGTKQSARGGGGVPSRSRPYDDEKERMLCEPLLDDKWEAVACRYGAGIRSEKRA